MDYLVSLFLFITGFLPFAYGSQGIQQLSPFKTVGSRVELASTTAGFRIPSLANLGCIGTDADGDFGSGSCSGGGGSGTVSTSTNETVGQLAFWSSNSGTPARLNQVATTTLTATSPLSLSNPVVKVGGSNSVLTIATSTLFGAGTPGQVLGWDGTKTVWVATSTCIQITGSADLCDGSDATGAGGAYPFPLTGNATSTLTGFNGGIALSDWNLSTSTVVTKNATFGEYTTVQSAIDANWRPITLQAGTYSEQLTLANTKTKLRGESLLSIIQANGVTQSPAINANAKDETHIDGITVSESNAADAGVGIEFSMSSLNRLTFSRINNFSTSTRFRDTGAPASSNTFYELLLGNTFFNCGGACIELSGTQANANVSIANRSRPTQTSNGGFGHYLEDVRGWTSIGDDIEGTTTGNGVTGLYVGTTSREVTYVNPWIEANQLGVNIDTGARRVNFFGGSITSNGTDIINNGTDICFWNVSVTGVTRNECNGNFSILSPGIFYASTTISDNATTTSLGVLNLTAANCDVKSTTNGSLYCGTDATGTGGSDPFTHPATGQSATSSLMLFNGAASSTLFSANGPAYFGATATSSFSTAGVLTVASAIQHSTGGILTFSNSDTAGHFQLTSGQTLNSSSGTDIFSRLAPTINQSSTAGTNVLEVDTTNTALGSGRQNLLALQSANTDRFVFGFDGSSGFGTSTPKWNVQIASSTGPQLSLSDGSLTSNHWTFRTLNNNFYVATASPSTYATSTLSALTIDPNGVVTFPSANTATCIALTGSAALCDGTDDSSAGGGNSKWATSTDNAIYTNGLTNSLILGRATQSSRNCLLCLFATSTTGALINASTTAGFNGDILLVEDTSGTDLVRIAQDGAILGASLLQVATTITSDQGTLVLASAGAQISAADGVVTFLGRGNGNDEDLKIDLDNAAANTIAFTSSTGASTLDFGTLGIKTAGPAEFNNTVGISTSTPWGMLSVASTTYNYTSPLFIVSTSTDPSGRLFEIFATSTEQNPIAKLAGDIASMIQNGVRAIIGNWLESRGLALDQLNVAGRINTGDWFLAECQGGIGQAETTSGSDEDMACGNWGFQEDNNGDFQYSTNNALTASVSINYGTANNGAALTALQSASMSAATNTPILETAVRITSTGAATNIGTSTRYIGMTNTNPSGTTYETPPTQGCYFTASSTEANWKAVCSSSASAMTIVDTTIPTTTTDFYRFRIEMDQAEARFYTQGTSTKMTLLTKMSGANYPTARLAPVIMVANVSAAANSFAFIHVQYARLWYRRTLWPN